MKVVVTPYHGNNPAFHCDDSEVLKAPFLNQYDWGSFRFKRGTLDGDYIPQGYVLWEYEHRKEAVVGIVRPATVNLKP